ncbi:MAG: site-2 protease family protein [Bianqueaceae bacterium]
MRGIDFLIGLLYSIPAVLIAISMHEFAHGFVSYKLGDPTPKMDGRLSLNPFRHLDVMGTLCLLVAGFGWAKPVMVNPEYYKNKKRGMVLVALAGPVMNFLLAFLFLFLYYLLWKLSVGIQGQRWAWSKIY